METPHEGHDDACPSRQRRHACVDLAEIAYPETKRTSSKHVSGGEHGDPFVGSAKCYRDIEAWDCKPRVVEVTKHLDGH